MPTNNKFSPFACFHSIQHSISDKVLTAKTLSHHADHRAAQGWGLLALNVRNVLFSATTNDYTLYNALETHGAKMLIDQLDYTPDEALKAALQHAPAAVAYCHTLFDTLEHASRHGLTDAMIARLPQEASYENVPGDLADKVDKRYIGAGALFWNSTDMMLVDAEKALFVKHGMDRDAYVRAQAQLNIAALTQLVRDMSAEQRMMMFVQSHVQANYLLNRKAIWARMLGLDEADVNAIAAKTAFELRANRMLLTMSPSLRPN